LAERELIEHVRALARGERPPWLAVGIGDDAAEVEVPGGGRLLVTTDAVTEGVHFEPGTPPAQVGWKAVARAHSDIAAMAAHPLCTVAAVAMPPDRSEEEQRLLLDALWHAAADVGAPLVGGDVAASPAALSVTVTALGTPGPGGAITRSGARAGDAVCVTGRLGGAILGRHLSFRPRIAEALALSAGGGLHAMIDLSDGLSTDALHIAEMSGVPLLLEAGRIPISDDAGTLAERTGRDPLWHALNDGEDYELLFCLPPAAARAWAERGVEGVEVTVIGEVAPAGEESLLIMTDESRQVLRPGGWEHLSGRGQAGGPEAG